jgi:hypothetical protein
VQVVVNLGDFPLTKRSRFLGLFIKPVLDALVEINPSPMTEPPRNLQPSRASFHEGGATATTSRRGASRSSGRQERPRAFASRGDGHAGDASTTCSFAAATAASKTRLGF